MSDHYATCITLKIHRLANPQHKPRWNTRKAEWPLFRQALTEQLCNAPPPEDLNLLEQRLTTAFHTAADKTIPLTKAFKEHYKEWWYYDKNVKEYKHRVNQAKKLHRRHNNETTRALLRAAARTAREGTKAIKNT